jgi:elongation factor 2
MSNKEHIRNIGIIAHIDHGKTTLADSLLAGAGLLSPQMAGTARVLDYLDEEQKRKITIKTANITLLYSQGDVPYIVNLVDTPGHVDFTGKVTRALRVIDGAVVVVDAVEEIMAQTEILTRQALKERVRPVLFINKVDRLITELQLSEEEIQKKLNHLIAAFNDQIDLYAEVPFRSQWKVSAAAGTVAFGSALHGWGFTLNMAKRRGIKFSDLVAAYKNRQSAKLSKSLPVYEAIFEMATKAIPNPRAAQAYRVEKIWDGAVDSPVGRALVDCSDDAAAVMFVTHIRADPEGGTYATGRVFSGKIRKTQPLSMVDSEGQTEVKAVFVDMGALREEVLEASAGNLATLQLVGQVALGETLIDATYGAGMVPFEGISYVSEPVVTLAIEPKNPQDLEALHAGLVRLTSEDPNLRASIDEQTGEVLLSGMGELHLEIALNQLKAGVELAFSSPRVMYMECAQKCGVEALAKSPDKKSSFWVQVEPAGSQEVGGTVLLRDDHGNALVDRGGKACQQPEEALQALKAGFQYACHAGPLCGEPIHNLQVNITNLQLAADAANAEVMHGVGKAIFASFLTAQPNLHEPIYKITLVAAQEIAGESSRILGIRRGKVTGFEQKGLLSQITGYIPVAETFGFSKELRSATSGRAVWQLFFDHWETLPPKQAALVIAELRKRRGLAAEVPKPEKFMEI